MEEKVKKTTVYNTKRGKKVRNTTKKKKDEGKREKEKEKE